MAAKKRKHPPSNHRAEAAEEQRTLRLVQSEDVLRHQANILASVLNCVGEGIVVADPSGKFLLFNPMAEKILGIGPLDATIDQWSEKYGLFHPDGKTTFASQDLPLARALQGIHTDEVEMFVRNRKIPEGVFLAVTGRPLRDEKGSLLGGVVVFRDISRQKNAEGALREILKGMEARISVRTSDLLQSNAKLKAVNEIQAHLSALISCELKTPLTFIRESFDLISEGIDGPVTEEQKETLALGRRHTDELGWLIGNFLNFIKIESDKLPMTFGPVDVAASVGEAVRSATPSIRKKGLRLISELSTQVSKEPFTIRGDGSKISEMAANLIEIVSKYTRRGGEVSVRLGARGRQNQNEGLALEVESSGPGTKLAERDKVFAAFDRSPQGVWRTGGNGVALAVCRYIVERHGGVLSADRLNETGSRLTVLLPGSPC